MKKLLSLLLVFVMIFSLLPASALAEESIETEEETVPVEETIEETIEETVEETTAPLDGDNATGYEAVTGDVQFGEDGTVTLHASFTLPELTESGYRNTWCGVEWGASAYQATGGSGGWGAYEEAGKTVSYDVTDKLVPGATYYFWAAIQDANETYLPCRGEAIQFTVPADASSESAESIGLDEPKTIAAAVVEDGVILPEKRRFCFTALSDGYYQIDGSDSGAMGVLQAVIYASDGSRLASYSGVACEFSAKANEKFYIEVENYLSEAAQTIVVTAFVPSVTEISATADQTTTSGSSVSMNGAFSVPVSYGSYYYGFEWGKEAYEAYGDSWQEGQGELNNASVSLPIYDGILVPGKTYYFWPVVDEYTLQGVGTGERYYTGTATSFTAPERDFTELVPGEYNLNSLESYYYSFSPTEGGDYQLTLTGDFSDLIPHGYELAVYNADGVRLKNGTGTLSFTAAAGEVYYIYVRDSCDDGTAALAFEKTASAGGGDETVVASGTCGENVTWSLDSDGKLTISGTGAMKEYYDPAPWYRYEEDIRSVVFSDGVTSIGSSAFSDCTSLTSITIPAGVTSIGSNVFSGCTALTEINVEAENTAYCSEDGVLFDKSKTTLICYPTGKSVDSYTIPSGVESIESRAFYGCTSLTSVTIPDGVTTIGNGAFRGCTSLTGITIPVSVRYIEGYAFGGCTSLKDVYYGGTEEQWSEIEVDSDNKCLTDATFHSSDGSVFEVVVLYNLSLPGIVENGSVAVTVNGEELGFDQKVPAEATVQIVATGDEGYGRVYSSLTYREDGESRDKQCLLETVESPAGTFTFTMPAGDVSAYFSFYPDEAVKLTYHFTMADGREGTLASYHTAGVPVIITSEKPYWVDYDGIFSTWAVGSLEGEKLTCWGYYLFDEDTDLYAVMAEDDEIVTLTLHYPNGTSTWEIARNSRTYLEQPLYFAEDGKVSNSWSTQPDGGGTVYSAGWHRFSENIELYPVYKDAIEITFFDEEGELCNSRAIGKGDSYELPERTAETGVVRYWSAGSADSQTHYLPGETVCFDTDTALYAVLVEEEVKLSFYNSTGDQLMVVRGVEKNVEVSLSDVNMDASPYSVRDKSHLGWSLEPDGEVLGQTATFSEDTDLYAVFAPSVLVVYDANGGECDDYYSGRYSCALGSYLTEYTAADDFVTREGYWICGWSTDKEGTKRFDFSQPITGHTTLYAVWKPIIAGEDADEMLGGILDRTDDNTTPDDVRDYMQQIDKDDLTEALASENSAAVIEKLAELESKVGGNVTVEVADGAGVSGASIVGATLNDVTGDVKLTISAASEETVETLELPEEVSDDENKVVHLQMELTGVADSSDLSVPVCITIEVPDNIQWELVRLVHHTDDGQTEVLTPTTYVDEKTGVRYARFVIGGFSPFTLTEMAHTLGDVNGQDGVNILDVLALLKYVAGIDSTIVYGDVNNSGKIDILDVLTLLKYVAKIEGTVVY